MFETDLNLKTKEDFFNHLKTKLQKEEIFLTDYEILKQLQFLEILSAENKKYNLTSIIKFEDMVLKHTIDSLLVLKVIDLNDNMTLLDVGAGAGFPSTPIAISKKLKKIVQLDSLKKRVNFLNMVKQQLNLKIEAIHGRAEELALDVNFREKFSLVVARAVSKLNILLEICLPFVELNGVFIALKGPDYEKELDESYNAISQLGGEIMKIANFKIENSMIRNLILVKKISHTSTKYPRSFPKISKNPL